MSQFHFLRPDWFWLLLPAGLWLLWLWRSQLRSRSWQAICDPQLLPYLLLGRSQRRGNWPLLLMLLALLLAITALAGPVWKRLPQPLFRQQSALVILYDLSASMLAEDLKPNRLIRARLKIADILNQRREGQTALVVFAGDAFTVTPLTDDARTISALLDSLEPGLMPVLGSRPQLAIERGAELLRQAGLAEGELLLVTDEDQPESALAAAERLRQDGYRLSVLGVGSEAGAPIPLPGGGFLKDRTGQLVLPQLQPARLAELARAGGGEYRTIRVDDADLRQLLEHPLSQRLGKERQQSDQLGDRWREEGVWLLWPLALLVACAFRRGWLTLIVLCGALTAPAEAFDWQQLWQRADQQGAAAFERQDYPAAGQLFKNPRWQASARYRAGDYQAALEALPEPQSADDYYNRGNALAKIGQLQEALQAYQQALQLNPDDADARENKRLVEQALQQQKQQADRSQDQQGQSGQQVQQKQPDQQSQQGDAEAQQRNGAQGGEPDQAQPAGDERSQQADPQQQSTPSDDEQNRSAAAKQQAQQQTQAGAEDPQGQQPAAAEKKPSNDAAESAQQAQMSRSEQPPSEQERAAKQWLQRIPDDPGGLLRRKFLYQYRQRERTLEDGKSW